MGDQLGLGSLLEDFGSAMPGIDEAMSFAEVLKLVTSLKFSVVVFDTAPTGHTLRFLSFPDLLEKALSKMESMKGQFGGMMKQFGAMMGMPEGGDDLMVRILIVYGFIFEYNWYLLLYYRCQAWHKLEN